MLILDSSFLVALFVLEDENHKEATEMMPQNMEEEMVLSDIILFETMTLLTYKKDFLFAKDVYSDLMANRKIRLIYLSEIERQAILMDFFAAKKRISVADTSVLYFAKKRGAGILSFDRDLLRIYAKGN